MEPRKLKESSVRERIARVAFVAAVMVAGPVGCSETPKQVLSAPQFDAGNEAGVESSSVSSSSVSTGSGGSGGATASGSGGVGGSSSTGGHSASSGSGGSGGATSTGSGGVGGSGGATTSGNGGSGGGVMTGTGGVGGQGGVGGAGPICEGVTASAEQTVGIGLGKTVEVSGYALTFVKANAGASGDVKIECASDPVLESTTITLGKGNPQTVVMKDYTIVLSLLSEGGGSINLTVEVK